MSVRCTGECTLQLPRLSEDLIDVELEENMELVRSLVVLGRAARNNSGIKNRQPLSRMLVKAEQQLPIEYSDIVKMN